MSKERPRRFSTGEIGNALVSCIHSSTGIVPEDPCEDINRALGPRYIDAVLIDAAEKAGITAYKPKKVPLFTLEEINKMLGVIEKGIEDPVADPRLREFLGGSAMPLAMTRVYLMMH